MITPTANLSALMKGSSQVIAGLGKHRELGPLIGLLALGLLFEVLSDGKFLTFGLLSALAALSASLGVVALGVTMLMISGEFDLSVSQTFALAPIVMGTLMTDLGWGASVALCLALIAVFLVGLINGLMSTLARIPSLIVTLGMLFVVTSFNRILAGGFPVQLFGNEGPLISLMGGDVPGTPVGAPFLWMLAIGGILWFVLGRTQYGSWTRAAGHQGGQVGRAMGVPVRTVKLINFVLCSILAGLAGCLQLADFGSSGVNSGENYNLLAIVAVVMGGTSLFGVRGTILGTLLGTLMLGSLKTGLVLAGTSGEYYTGLIGTLLLVAALVNAKTESLRRGGSERSSLFG